MKQALLLAAGFSTRLLPLTEKIPKTMLPFLHESMFDFSYQYLKHYGITDLAINLHHGREACKSFLEEKQLKNVTIFMEDKILGTGGGIKNMASAITDDTFCIINCDFVTTVDLQKAFAYHKEKKALATLVLVENKTNKYANVETDSDQKITNFCKRDGNEKYFFSGIHILSKEIFNHMPNQDKFCIIQDVYQKLIEDKAPIYGMKSDAAWFDTGETKEYEETQLACLPHISKSWAESTFYTFEKLENNIWTSYYAIIDDTVTLKENTFIGHNCTIEKNCTIGPNVNLTNGIHVKEGTTIENKTILPPEF